MERDAGLLGALLNFRQQVFEVGAAHDDVVGLALASNLEHHVGWQERVGWLRVKSAVLQAENPARGPTRTEIPAAFSASNGKKTSSAANKQRQS